METPNEDRNSEPSQIENSNSSKSRRQLDMSLYILVREQRLRRVARDMGYENVHSMLCDLYLNDGYAIPALARCLQVSIATVRRLLIKHEIPIRVHGGGNNRKVEVTEALYEEICRNGVPATAERLGVHHSTLRWQLDKYRLMRKAAAAQAQTSATKPAAGPAREPPKAPPAPPTAVDLYIRGHRITEQEVERCLRSAGDEVFAQYQREELSKEEAYEMTRAWLRQAMQFGRERY